MKVLSLKQPHAELVLRGKKTVDLRNWSTDFRGEFLIHAAKEPDLKACKAHKIDPKTLTHGAIVGRATIYGVKQYLSKKGFLSDQHRHLSSNALFEPEATYGFLLKDAERLRNPIPMEDSLNFAELETL